MEDGRILEALREAQPTVNPVTNTDMGWADPAIVGTSMDVPGQVPNPYKHTALLPYIQIKVDAFVGGVFVRKKCMVMGALYVPPTPPSSSSVSSPSPPPPPPPPSSYSSSSYSYTWSSYWPSSSSSSKSAMVQVGEEWVAYHCSEEPFARFSDTIEVTLEKGVVWAPLPQEIVESMEENSIVVTSALPDKLAYISACVIKLDGVWGIWVEARRLWWFGMPKQVVVRIEGRRKGFAPARWARYSEEQFQHNLDFWDLARL